MVVGFKVVVYFELWVIEREWKYLRIYCDVVEIGV